MPGTAVEKRHDKQQDCNEGQELALTRHAILLGSRIPVRTFFRTVGVVDRRRSGSKGGMRRSEVRGQIAEAKALDEVWGWPDREDFCLCNLTYFSVLSNTFEIADTSTSPE